MFKPVRSFVRSFPARSQETYAHQGTDREWKNDIIPGCLELDHILQFPQRRALVPLVWTKLIVMPSAFCTLSLRGGSGERKVHTLRLLPGTLEASRVVRTTIRTVAELFLRTEASGLESRMSAKHVLYK